jgi:predicted phosphodiesterase
MQILIISDIHANLTALESVLADAGSFDAAWCLGDLVGYGPDPNECVDRVRALPGLQCIVGNHDAAALRRIDSDSFNPEARQAIYWTQQALTDHTRQFLSGLVERITLEKVTLTHGSPRHPVWEYLLDTRTATDNFNYFTTPWCFVGHTHLPVIYSVQGDDHQAKLIVPEPNQSFSMPQRAIINPGSVGQPRDRDPRAAYAIYDPDNQTWNYRRVEYDIPAVQARMRAHGLPDRHIQRLVAGW